MVVQRCLRQPGIRPTAAAVLACGSQYRHRLRWAIVVTVYAGQHRANGVAATSDPDWDRAARCTKPVCAARQRHDCDPELWDQRGRECHRHAAWAILLAAYINRL